MSSFSDLSIMNGENPSGSMESSLSKWEDKGKARPLILKKTYQILMENVYLGSPP